jgi:DNA-binding transcriptional regulator of glucitol operon
VTAGRIVRRLLVVVLVAAFAVVCLRLGWWQWQRYQSASGSAQNLGYTLQWPTFALFAIFMWWRLSKLEAKRRQERTEAAGSAQPAPAAPAPAPPSRAVTPSDEPDDELAAYNRYLAQLHAKESDRAQ